jgi:endonuclease/exonuclease/phosphatase (EEP) superfamily protein YafD
MFSPRWVFALPLAVLLPAAVFLRSWSALVPLAAGLVALGPATGFNVPWQRLTGDAPPGTPFRAMTLNMHYSDADPGPLEALVADARPDVVSVQEWPGSGRSSLQTNPDWHVHATPRQFLASRHPIRRAVDLGDDSMGEHASLVRYELDTPAGVVHVFSLHTATDRQGITDTLHENRKGPAEIRANSARRREQSAYVAGRAAECGGPVVVMGDFNTSPESPIFTDVWGGYTDAFSAAGWGWGYTFIGARTAVRIDHVLAGRGWSAAGCRVGPSVGSPHRPVIADLVWAGEGRPRE